MLITLVVAFLAGNGGICSACFLSSLYHHLVEGHHSHEGGRADPCCCHDHEDSPCEHYECTHADAADLDVALPESAGRTVRESISWLHGPASVLADSGIGPCPPVGRRILLLPLTERGRPPAAPLFILNEQLLI